MEQELMEQEGYSYKFDPSACEACGGHCCTGESGYIWAKYAEIEKMADFVNLSIDNYACVFFDEEKKRCSIYPVRPLQCRTFPFWEQFKNDEDEVRKECPGIV